MRQGFNDPFSLHDELALLVDSGVPVAEALRAATVYPVEFLNLQDVGEISTGMRADLVILDANPLEDISNAQRIQAVILRGRYFDRQALDELLNDAELLAESN